MTVEEIRELFRSNTTCEYTPDDRWGQLDLQDPYYKILNMAIRTLAGDPNAPTEIKVGDNMIKLLSVSLHEDLEGNVDTWMKYQDAFCTAIFEIQETGDRFKVTGENGSWGWGALSHESSLDQIELIGIKYEAEIDQEIQHSIDNSEFVRLAKELAEAKDRILWLEAKMIQLKRNMFGVQDGL